MPDDIPLASLLERLPYTNPTVLPDAAANALRNAGIGIGHGLMTLPERLMHAAGDLQRRGDVYDPAPAVEAALMTMGATPFSAPAGALGAGVVLPKGIRAYHGSPHDFERFDLSKIGTGEGAQAYGHGLYFAENPKVAESYKMYPQQTLGSPEYYAQLYLSHADGDAAHAAYRLLQDTPGSRNPELYKKAAELIEGGWKPEKGKMYEVNINAHPEQFLDWDKPLAQQPKAISSALEQVGVRPPSVMGEPAEWLQQATGIKKWEPTGHSVYHALGAGESATGLMREAGIPGIKYLDQGSRGKAFNVELHTSSGKYAENAFATEAEAKRYAAEKAAEGFQTKLVDQGSRNYVLFDDKLVDIIRKYGIAAGIPLGSLPAVLGQPSQSQSQ